MFGISSELSDKMSNSKASKDIFKEVASCHKSIGGRVFCKFFLLFFVILDMNHSIFIRDEDNTVWKKYGDVARAFSLIFNHQRRDGWKSRPDIRVFF